MKDLLAKQAQLNACLDLDKHETQIVDEPREPGGIQPIRLRSSGSRRPLFRSQPETLRPELNQG
jgi:hypothetical protein